MEFFSAGLWAILSPSSTINDIMASDTESIPSAVATTLPLRYPVTISTIPIAKRVTTDIFAILLPAIIPSLTRLEEKVNVTNKTISYFNNFIFYDIF